MLGPSRCLVWWRSSINGDNYQQVYGDAKAESVLDRKSDREDFVRGAVIPASELGEDQGSFRRRHEEYARSVA